MMAKACTINIYDQENIRLTNYFSLTIFVAAD